MVAGVRIAAEEHDTSAGSVDPTLLRSPRARRPVDDGRVVPVSPRAGGARGAAAAAGSKAQVHPAPGVALAQPQALPAAAQSAAISPRVRDVQGEMQAASRKAAWDVAPQEQTQFEVHGEVFIPLRVAKRKVLEVETDMRTLRDTHLGVISQVEANYKAIAQQQEEYYLGYINRLNSAAQRRDQGVW